MYIYVFTTSDGRSDCQSLRSDQAVAVLIMIYETRDQSIFKRVASSDFAKSLGILSSNKTENLTANFTAVEIYTFGLSGLRPSKVTHPASSSGLQILNCSNTGAPGRTKEGRKEFGHVSTLNGTMVDFLMLR